MPIISPKQVVPGNEIKASDVNDPINTIAGLVNGQLDNVNIATGGVHSNNIAVGGVQTNNIANAAVKPEKIDYAAMQEKLPVDIFPAGYRASSWCWAEKRGKFCTLIGRVVADTGNITGIVTTTLPAGYESAIISEGGSAGISLGIRYAEATCRVNSVSGTQLNFDNQIGAPVQFYNFCHTYLLA